MLDIDYGSPYHPRHDPLALDRINAALEPLGLLSSVTLTSSASHGLHIYYPFTKTLPSWQIATAISTRLENAGLKRIPGWLEVFPNPKPFSSDGSLSLYNGHRLPLQSGSYLLDKDLNPTSGSKQQFTSCWQTAANHNDIDAATLHTVIRQTQRQTYRVSQKATKFLNDLNTEIELGWTGQGQTNRLLGRIAMRSYIFGHILTPGSPLTGDALINEIVTTAKRLPGYADFCGHQHEIKHRAEEWAKCVEASHYYPYGTDKPLTASTPAISEPEAPSWNQQQQFSARDRITTAMTALIQQDKLPGGITARYDVLTKAGISGSTLYRHKDLWHPVHINPVENPPDPPTTPKGKLGLDCSEQSNPNNSPNLLGAIECNLLQNNASTSSTSINKTSPGYNSSPDQENQPRRFGTMTPQQGVNLIQQLLSRIKQGHVNTKLRPPDPIAQPPDQHQQLAFNHHQTTQQRMMQWLHSQDPILQAEAKAWLSAHGIE